ncbi:hypothetical protein MP228_004570 [Amoeboaphelidium protococcarum]|nr:hypothetical protein MP228_004570 [Amoeboaphelidium protococcarum]
MEPALHLAEYKQLYDVLGGMPLPSCPHNPYNLALDQPPIDELPGKSSIFGIPSASTSLISLFGFAFAFMFVLIIFIRLNSIYLFGRVIDFKSVQSHLYGYTLLILSIALLLNAIRYMINLPYYVFMDSGDGGQRYQQIQNGKAVDNALLLTISVLNSLSLFILTLALHWNWKYRTHGFIEFEENELEQIEQQQQQIDESNDRQFDSRYGIFTINNNNNNTDSSERRNRNMNQMSGGGSPRSQANSVYDRWRHILRRSRQSDGSMQDEEIGLLSESSENGDMVPSTSSSNGSNLVDRYEFGLNKRSRRFGFPTWILPLSRRVGDYISGNRWMYKVLILMDKIALAVFIIHLICMYMNVAPLPHSFNNIFTIVYLSSYGLVFVPLLCLVLAILIKKSAASSSSTSHILNLSRSGGGGLMNNNSNSVLDRQIVDKHEGPTQIGKAYLSLMTIFLVIGFSIPLNNVVRIIYDSASSHSPSNDNCAAATLLKCLPLLSSSRSENELALQQDILSVSLFDFIIIAQILAIMFIYLFARSEFKRVKQRMVWFIVRRVTGVFGFNDINVEPVMVEPQFAVPSSSSRQDVADYNDMKQYQSELIVKGDQSDSLSSDQPIVQSGSSDEVSVYQDVISEDHIMQIEHILAEQQQGQSIKYSRYSE